MNFEVFVLGLSALLAVVQLFLYAIPANLTLGSDYLAGPRDEKRELSGRAARLQRAFNNHVEGLVLFTAAVVVVTMSGQSSGFTQGCALVYLAARVAYVPLYAAGSNPWRSVVWGFGFFATVAMLVAALI